MKLIKIEKVHCPACNVVGAFLDDTGVEYTKLDSQAPDKDGDRAREFLGELGLFTVPVTVLVDEFNKVVDHARGVDTGKLQELVDQVK